MDPITLNSIMLAVRAVMSSDNFAPITPDNATDFAATRGLIVAVAGTLKVKRALDDADETIDAPAGVLPIQITRLYATGTSATGFTGLW